MIPDTVFGLPSHVLLIHAIVVLAPLGALFTVLSAVWPAAHRKLGFISPLTCLIVLILTPVTTSAGDYLRDKIDPQHQNPKINEHVDLGENLIWFAIGLFIVSTAVWWIGRRYQLDPRGGRANQGSVDEPVGSGGGTATATRTRTRTRPQTDKAVLPAAASVLVMVVAVVMSALTVWWVYRVGDAGAHAVWQGFNGGGGS